MGIIIHQIMILVIDTDKVMKNILNNRQHRATGHSQHHSATVSLMDEHYDTQAAGKYQKTICLFQS